MRIPQRISALFQRARLPARVRKQILGQQHRSEILIGWIQLSVVVIFAFLYAIAPKPYNFSPLFEPVPWALAAYAVFTLVRLRAATRSQGLLAWFLALSIFVDVALLLVLIWSFHLQYQQPPAFVLKAPTFLYVFIFVALRTLRFEAGYVVLTGAVAAAGWGLLVLYVVRVDPADPMITRDYVVYLTSNSALLGAEFDKIASVLIVTAVLALAIHRARKLLEHSVTFEHAALDLSRFLSPEIASQITHSEQRLTAGHGDVREAAILTMDLRDFSRLAARISAREVMEVLRDYQGRMVPILQRHGASIDKFLGDGILASFGAAVPTGTYAADALRAADEVLQESERWRAQRAASGQPPLKVGVACTTGPVVFGIVGHGNRLEFTVIGEPVNLAAKLEKHTKREGTPALTTRAAFLLAMAQGYRTNAARPSLPQRSVEGVVGAVDLVALSAGTPG